MTIKEAAAEMIKAARELDSGLSGFELEVNGYRIVVEKVFRTYYQDECFDSEFSNHQQNTKRTRKIKNITFINHLTGIERRVSKKALKRFLKIDRVEKIEKYWVPNDWEYLVNGTHRFTKNQLEIFLCGEEKNDTLE